MPLNRYYGGHGKQVMAKMKREYGPEKGESVFYATANARKKQTVKRPKGKRTYYQS